MIQTESFITQAESIRTQAQSVITQAESIMTHTESFITLGISIGLGMLVGIQRERAGSENRRGGVRTFPLVTVLGSATAMLTPTMGPWLAVAAFVGVVAAPGFGNLTVKRQVDPERGLTTQMAMMVMFVVGAMLATDMQPVAVALGVGTAILLQLKGKLHTVALKVGDTDLLAIFQFALITFIILPVLPNKTFGPFDVLNPYRIWLMVVLVVGISLAGYIALHIWGKIHGTLVAGLLGGVISSTATTVSYAQRTRKTHNNLPSTTAVLLLATFVLYIRMIVELAVAAPDYVSDMGMYVALIGIVTLLCAAISLLSVRKGTSEMPEHTNPSELKGAVLFGLMYAAVLFLTAWAKNQFGDTGMYTIAVLSGITDMNAITLSLGRLTQEGRLDVDVAWKALMLASIANLVFKIGVLWFLGSFKLAIRLALWFGIITLATIAVVLFL